MKNFKKNCLIFFPLILAGCGQLQQFRDLSDIDCNPPAFISFTQAGPESLQFEFSEAIDEADLRISIYPEDFGYATEVIETCLIIHFDGPAVPGKEYALEASIPDCAGNSLYMLYPFYGFNPDLPDLVINEFTTQGSSSHPDVVELYALSSGNIAGMAIFEGIAELYDDYLVFPSCEIEEGEYILVHFKPDGIPEEVDEILASDASGGKDASANARDFWVNAGDGLGGNNGAVCICTNPGGRIIDAVLYSNRTSSSDTNYSGFGSNKFKSQAETVFALGEWTAAGDSICPEDCINPDDSTSTRSICRDIQNTDTNSRTDWMIVATGEFSFGEENSTAIYEKNER